MLTLPPITYDRYMAEHGGNGGSYCDRADCSACQGWRSYHAALARDPRKPFYRCRDPFCGTDHTSWLVYRWHNFLAWLSSEGGLPPGASV